VLNISIKYFILLSFSHYLGTLYTVKMNMRYLIKKKCDNRLQAILLIKFNKLELSNNSSN